MRGLRERIGLFVIGRKVALFRFLIRWDAFWRLARRVKPVLVFPPGMVWVSRHDDVIDVLARDRDFRVPYLRNLEGLSSPFLLGLPDGDDYQRQLTVLRHALRHLQLPKIKELSIRAAKRALADANGEIDVVRDLTERVLRNTVGAHLGMDPVTPAQLEQSRAIFYEVFINALDNPVVTKQAHAAGAALRAHIAELVADRRAAMRRDVSPRDDVLDQLVRAMDRGELTTDELINSLLGLFVGWTGPVSRSMGFGIDALLKQPEAIRLGRDAALKGGPDAMEELMREALRFQPSAPALERICARETHIAGRCVRRGAKVMVLLNSAMMDRDHVRDPRRFDPDRGKESNLHFGGGQHCCIGAHISMVQIGAISSVLLAQPHVRRGGKLECEGPYPSRLLVAFDRAPA